MPSRSPKADVKSLFYFCFSSSGGYEKINASEESNSVVLSIRGIEWSIQNDASRKISAESRNLGIQNKSLGISGSLHVEPSRSLEFL